jgi:CubicO group peptidase (beta-lactamase class C family)
MRSAVSFTLVAALFAGGQAAAQTAPSSKIAAVENGLLINSTDSVRPPPQPLQSRMAALHVPGVSITVIDHGVVAWSKAYGVADSVTKTPVTTATRFQAASISKTIAAATAISLVVETKIDLDAPVNGVLKGWAVPASEIAPGYTPSLRALLSHSAGLSVHGFLGYAVGQPLPTLIQVLDGAPPANSEAVRIDHKPGVWSYSGGGYTVVQKLIGDVTGRPFADIAQERVLAPVGMQLSTFTVPSSTDVTFATAHSASGEPIPGRWHIYPEQAAAGLWTTPSDLAKWALAVSRAAKGDGAAGVDPRVARLLLQRQSGLDTGVGGMGLGFFLNKQTSPPGFSHSGGNVGFRCDLFLNPETGQGVVIMTNSDSGTELAFEIERSVAVAYGWPGEHYGR